MRRVLLPINDSSAARCATRYVIADFRTSDEAMDIHVLNVQPPLRRHIAQFVSKTDRESFYRDEAETALRPVRKMLDEAALPYSVHTRVGPKAETITSTARRVGCDHIVMGTSRKSSITRAIESSVTNKVLELTDVPVVVIAAGNASKAERYGVPAGLAAALTLLLYAAAD